MEKDIVATSEYEHLLIEVLWWALKVVRLPV